MKIPAITKFRSLNCSIYCCYVAIFGLLFSWVPMTIFIWYIPIYGTLFMGYLIIISLSLMILSLLIFFPIELILLFKHKISALRPDKTKRQGCIIISLAFLLLLFSLRFFYEFWILGIVKNPNID